MIRCSNYVKIKKRTIECSSTSNNNIFSKRRRCSMTFVMQEKINALNYIIHRIVVLCNVPYCSFYYYLVHQDDTNQCSLL